MPSIKELEDQLRVAKAQAEAQQRELTYYTEQLLGKAFMVACSHPTTKYRDGWKTCILTKYTGLKLNGQGNINWSGEEVTVTVDSRHTWGFSYSKHTDSLLSTKSPHVRTEIPLGRFKTAVEYSKVSANSVMAHLRSIYDNKEALDWIPHQPVQEEDAGLDIPYITLVGSERSLLDRTPFTTVADRYIITPQSVKLACALIDKARSALYSGSSFFQSCDMAYVHGQEKMFTELRTKVTHSAMSAGMVNAYKACEEGRFNA